MSARLPHLSVVKSSCAAALLSLALVAGCHSDEQYPASPVDAGPTDIVLTSTVIQSGVKRLGMNVGGQNYYDSGQMLRNLTFINPGFEGETWQSILRCKAVTATSCTDGNQWTQWPVNFLQGAQFEVISGAALGAKGTVTSSEAANPHIKDQGVVIDYAEMAQMPAAGDFILVKKTIPGDPTAGWWTDTAGGGSFAAEYTDLAPNSPGKQALKVIAKGEGQSVSVNSYFDSMAGHSFVQLHGNYRLTFRAKGLGGNNELHLDLRRMAEHEPEIFLNKLVILTPKWKDYSFDFAAVENGNSVGTVGLSFRVSGTDMLLDDVGLSPVGSAPDNPTAFRDEVVTTLRQLHPGILRYHDGDHLGSSIDNLIAPPFARVRAGYAEGTSQQTLVPMGLPEFLKLCQTVEAEPWFNLPAGISPDEMKNLIEYLAGPATTPYGAKRAAMGQKSPWTTVFPVIHLELGNEEWNGVTFAGSAMPDPVAYGQRAKQVFLGGRSSEFYQAEKFDLVIGTFALMPDWTQKELAASGGYDSTAVAPYLFDRFDDDSSTEAIFGPMLAQPEMLDSLPTGYMTKQAKVAKENGTTLSVYEVNIGTASGSAPQESFDQTVPSIGAGITLIDHMLLMLRDLGIKNQSVWALPGYGNGFQNSFDNKPEHTPLFGTVIDMGGPTNLRRPQFLAEQLANQAILPNMVATKITGANPTWNQPLSQNDDIKLDKAHYLQTFAFADGNKRSLVILNLSRTDALPVTFSGDKAPAGSIDVSQLTSTEITDSNEKKNTVAIVKTKVMIKPGEPFSVAPFSMTVLKWTVN